MQQPLISIIVPAYNVEKYISECLDSLVNQTIRNHKVIIINDGSKDHTEQICQTYQQRYSDFISYEYQENQGLGEARNHGMQLVETPFVTFLDSDDWLNIRYVEMFTKLIDETDEMPDITFTLPWVYDSVTKRIWEWNDKSLYDKVFEVEHGYSSVITNACRNPQMYGLEVSACRKIYRTNFLKKNNFKFPKGLKWEDVPGHFMLLHKANNCMALPEAGFFYRINHESQITSGSGKSRLDMIPIFLQLLDIQDNENFNSIEKGYVIYLIVKFSLWSLEVISTDYIAEYLCGLHKVFARLEEEDINYYLYNICDTSRIEYVQGYINCIRSKKYYLLNDYDKRDAVIYSYKPWNRRIKDFICIGKHYIRQRGIFHTIKHMIKICFQYAYIRIGRK